MQRKFQIIDDDESLDEETKTNLKEKVSNEFDLETESENHAEDDIETQSKEKIEIQDTRSKFTTAVAKFVGEKKQFLSVVSIFFSYSNMNLW